MIEFLVGAFSVLAVRAGKIVKTLKKKRDIPSSAIEHCRRVSKRTTEILASINNKQDVLLQIQDRLKAKKITLSQIDGLLKDVLKAYRDLRRDIDIIEEDFVGHIVRYNKADRFFTQLASALWKETNLPDIPPVAVTNTSGYFCTLADLGIVFSPPSSEHHLLIVPDLYHEFGHILHKSLKIKLFGKRFSAELTSHVVSLKNQIRQTSRPLKPETISDIAFRWINSWAEEVACDALATYLLGPAYGWCNLHLCLQVSNVFESGNKHPADAARTKQILKILRRRGFNDDASKIEKLWNKYLQLSRQTSTSYYHDYHPDSLFTAIMEDVEHAIKDHGLSNAIDRPTIDILNESWKQFLESPSDYKTWEERAIATLKENFV